MTSTDNGGLLDYKGPRLPTWYVPRDYQIPVFRAMVTNYKPGRTNGKPNSPRQAITVWPRRAGKDITALNILVIHALTKRRGNYYYFLPSYTQGEKIIWDGKTGDGRDFLSTIPEQCIAKVDQRKLKITLVGGSIIQIVGASDTDSVVGTNPVGCVFSEYSLQNPKFYDYIRPILAENDGFALFTYTARGLNHGYRLYDANKDNPNWFVELRTVESVLHEGKRIITDDILEEERRSGMSEELMRQEYFNDFYASNSGAYYAIQMRRAQQENRIGQVPWKPELPVHTAWDLGRSDATAIWFFQTDANGNVNVIDTYTSTGEGLPHYIKKIKEKPYSYGSHFAPHDIKVADFSTNRSRQEIAFEHGIRFEVVPKLGVQDGIEAARVLLPKCRFDQYKCFDGLEALRQYAKKETGMVDMHGRPVYSESPDHNWASHFSDAFRYMAVAIERVMWHNSSIDEFGDPVRLPDSAISDDYDVLGG